MSLLIASSVLLAIIILLGTIMLLRLYIKIKSIKKSNAIKDILSLLLYVLWILSFALAPLLVFSYVERYVQTTPNITLNGVLIVMMFLPASIYVIKNKSFYDKAFKDSNNK